MLFYSLANSNLPTESANPPWMAANSLSYQMFAALQALSSMPTETELARNVTHSVPISAPQVDTLIGKEYLPFD